MAQDDIRPSVLYDALTSPYFSCNHQEDPLAPEDPLPLKICPNKKTR